MTDIVDQALALWGMPDAPCRLVAQRENMVYHVAAPQGPVALRMHRPGYRSTDELTSELHWMAALSQGGELQPASSRERAAVKTASNMSSVNVPG